MERGGAIAVNDALNKPKNKLGLDWRVALMCVGIGVSVALFLSFWLGVVLLFALPAAVRFALSKDPQIHRLWSLSFLQRAYYDPGKVAR